MVMSFGLKNTGATYQWAMVALFHDMMHKEIEVYVDDMISKSNTEEEHLINLWKLFERLWKKQLRLNPAKCTFRVKSGKLLGFVVSQKGIEEDLEKVKAILEMPKPCTKKKVRGFLGVWTTSQGLFHNSLLPVSHFLNSCARTILFAGTTTVKRHLERSNNALWILLCLCRQYPGGLLSCTWQCWMGLGFRV